MKLNKKLICFYLGYIFLFISLFIGDINIESGDFGQYLRYVSYLLFTIQLFSVKSIKIKELRIPMFFFLLSIVFFVLTRDLYWAILIIIILETKHIKDNSFIRFVFLLYIVGILAVFIACMLGIIPDYLTAREGIEFLATRHSLGFVHSDVPPLLLVYIMLYHIWRKGERYNRLFFCIFICLELIMYRFCDSRNSFYSSIIITILLLVSPLIKKRKIMNVYEKICIFIMPILSTFSFAMMFLLSKGGFYDTIDYIFSGRIRLAILKSREIGIHFINLMSNTDYFQDGIVIDNGYLYVILRYGIVFLFFYFTVNYLLVKKAQKNPYMLLCVVALSVINFIDNDLVDYSFLPFIIIAFSDENLKFIRNKRDWQ